MSNGMANRLRSSRNVSDNSSATLPTPVPDPATSHTSVFVPPTSPNSSQSPNAGLPSAPSPPSASTLPFCKNSNCVKKNGHVGRHKLCFLQSDGSLSRSDLNGDELRFAKARLLNCPCAPTAISPPSPQLSPSPPNNNIDLSTDFDAAKSLISLFNDIDSVLKNSVDTRVFSKNKMLGALVGFFKADMPGFGKSMCDLLDYSPTAGVTSQFTFIIPPDQFFEQANDLLSVDFIIAFCSIMPFTISADRSKFGLMFSESFTYVSRILASGGFNPACISDASADIHTRAQVHIPTIHFALKLSYLLTILILFVPTNNSTHKPPTLSRSHVTKRLKFLKKAKFGSLISNCLNSMISHDSSVISSNETATHTYNTRNSQADLAALAEKDYKKSVRRARFLISKFELSRALDTLVSNGLAAANDDTVHQLVDKHGECESRSVDWSEFIQANSAKTVNFMTCHSKFLAVLPKLRNCVSPGPDLLTFEHVKMLTSSDNSASPLFPFTCIIFMGINTNLDASLARLWSASNLMAFYKDSQLSKIRPIAKGSSFYKLIGKTVAALTKDAISELDPAQLAIDTPAGREAKINGLQSVMQECVRVYDDNLVPEDNFDFEVCAFRLDIVNCFNEINREQMKLALIDAYDACDALDSNIFPICSFASNFYSSPSPLVYNASHNSDDIRVLGSYRGVRQGCVLGGHINALVLRAVFNQVRKEFDDEFAILEDPNKKIFFRASIHDDTTIVTNISCLDFVIKSVMAALGKYGLSMHPIAAPNSKSVVAISRRVSAESTALLHNIGFTESNILSSGFFPVVGGTVVIDDDRDTIQALQAWHLEQLLSHTDKINALKKFAEVDVHAAYVLARYCAAPRFNHFCRSTNISFLDSAAKKFDESMEDLIAHIVDVPVSQLDDFHKKYLMHMPLKYAGFGFASADENADLAHISGSLASLERWSELCSFNKLPFDIFEQITSLSRDDNDDSDTKFLHTVDLVAKIMDCNPNLDSTKKLPQDQYDALVEELASLEITQWQHDFCYGFHLANSVLNVNYIPDAKKIYPQVKDVKDNQMKAFNEKLWVKWAHSCPNRNNAKLPPLSHIMEDTSCVEKIQKKLIDKFNSCKYKIFGLPASTVGLADDQVSIASQTSVTNTALSTISGFISSMPTTTAKERAIKDKVVALENSINSYPLDQITTLRFKLRNCFGDKQSAIIHEYSDPSANAYLNAIPNLPADRTNSFVKPLFQHMDNKTWRFMARRRFGLDYGIVPAENRLLDPLTGIGHQLKCNYCNDDDKVLDEVHSLNCTGGPFIYSRHHAMNGVVCNIFSSFGLKCLPMETPVNPTENGKRFDGNMYCSAPDIHSIIEKSMRRSIPNATVRRAAGPARKLKIGIDTTITAYQSKNSFGADPTGRPRVKSVCYMPDINIESARALKFKNYVEEADPVTSVLPVVISDSGRLDPLLCKVLKLQAKRKAFCCPNNMALDEWQKQVASIPSVAQVADTPDAPDYFDLSENGFGRRVPNFVSHTHQLNLFRKAAFMYSEACARIVAELHIQQAIIRFTKESDADQGLPPARIGRSALPVADSCQSASSCVGDSCNSIFNASPSEVSAHHHASLRIRGGL